ncbi:helix-turn-helix domain-containing protein [Alkalitalea saponilacus]|uniref:DNA-binding transcriptional regulator, XRE-family HTH domain n=1 Tax=Alkalitalea saponilacus TaxID=889453 RepID=A0A1T5DBZ0_9BACT|nr:helix-turn-helix transcriptional regulator [Alkalitalea saponilacus]ASB50651.1 transcriptional regulator [Alkalitalea saponilacus]SKB69020.1 DNA-binding transcriptional regulator, XRE-family HTH domain [Alkalitalea saponilacus]
MKERLQILLKKENLSPVKFSEIVGVQRSAVSHILSGRNNPSLEVIQKILKNFPHISSDWLITGNGEIYRADQEVKVKPPSNKPTGLFDTIKEEPGITYVTNAGSAEKDENEKPDNQSQKKENLSVETNQNVERIVVFYANGTFKEYKPTDN